MTRYYTPSLLIFSVVGGVVTYLIISGMTDMPTALLFSALTSLGISIAIPAMFAYADRKFIPLRKEIDLPILIDERVNYVVGQELRDGFILGTKESLFVLSSEDKKPIKFEIKKTDVKKISISDDIYLNIFLDYDKCIRVFADNCDELSQKLSDAGFGKY